MSHTIVLIGCGNMGYAMLKGWLGLDDDIVIQVVEPNAELRGRAADTRVTAVADISELDAALKPDLVILAVKPQMVKPVLEQCGRLANFGATFVSVAAGVTISSMAAALAPDTPIIRCMPNTPAAIGAGMMVLCAGHTVSGPARSLTENLFQASGSVAWVEDEALMDAVTAISGSGPAYVFHFIEGLTEAAMALGLPQTTADLLARQTVAGAGRMALESTTSPAILREQVTSPGGTTAAALQVFMNKDDLKQLILNATTAARDRGAELGKESG